MKAERRGGCCRNSNKFYDAAEAENKRRLHVTV